MSASISHAPNPTIAASSPAAPAHSSAGSSADVAAAPAGGPAHHGHASVSPVNGGGAIKPSMPTIVSSNGTAPIDHARKSSVHIKQMPPATGPPAIKFGALSSPAPAHSNLNVQAQNPRVASPAHSPSPIPHNPLSGGKPTDLPTRPNLVFGGQQGPDGAEANRGPNMPPHARRESSQSAHGSFSGRPGPHYSHPTYSPQPRTVMPNQHLGPRGVAPTFQPQANSPFRQNRSPAITPASLHQQQQFANPQGMPFYQPGPYPQQGMYNVPPQDAYNPYYTQNFTGLQQSMHYPGPGSPGRGHHGYPQQMQAQYGHAAYGPPQAQSMSRTPSNMSQPSIPQPSTPAMTNVNHITHTPSITSASPAPSSAAFERPKKQSKAIIIKNADGEVVDFNKPKGPSPATNAPAQPRSPAIAATPTPPPPRAPSAAPDDAPSKTAEEKKADFAKKIQETLRQESAKDTSDAAADEAKASQAAKDKEAEVAAKAKADAEEKAKTDAEAKAKADAEKAKTDAEAKATNDAKKAEVDAEEKKRLEDEEMERMIAEMEEEERKREEDEKRYAEEKKLKDAEKKAKAAESVREEEERLRKLEREAEEAEEAKESESPEQKAEREAKDKALFAGLKKNTQFGPQSTEQETASEETSTPEPAATVKSAPVATSKPKPTALKLDTNKSIEPSAPTAGMQSLKSARFLQVKSELVAYPEGIASPNPALNARNKGRTYDKDFLLQFQEVFKEKPSVDWDLKLKETVGDGSESARTPGPRAGGMMSGSGRQPSGRGGAPGGGMGNFQGASAPRTLPMGTTSAQRFEQSQRGGSSMTNPLAHMVPQRNGGGFAMGARNSSYQAAQPNSPRNASHSQRGPPRGGAGGGSRRGGGGGGRDSDAKTMPLTAGQNLKPIETTETGWKPTSITSTAPPVSGHMAPDMVQRKVKAALNKMTPEKFDKISDQILEIAAQSKDETDGRTLRQVIQLTFEKACDESHWSSMYAKFCSRMLATMSTDIKDENVKDKHGNAVVGGALFRKYLLNRCQEEFERGWEINLPEQPEDGKEGLFTDEYYIASAAKRKGLGLIQFIGELYKLGMLTLRIMHECVLKLLDFEGLPDESAIESLVKLLRTVGATMEAAEAGPKMIGMYFERIEKVEKTPGIPSRQRFMMLDLIDMRKNGWKGKDILKGPKTIAEIHQEAIAAQQVADMERQRSNQRGGGGGGGGGGGRMPMGRGDARSFSGGGMMPPPDTSRVQMDDLRKLSKGASGRNMNASSSLGPSLLSGRAGSGRRGLGPGMSGRDDSGNSSRTGTPPVQKEKETTAHANAFSALAALEDNAGDVSSPPATTGDDAAAKPSE